MPSLHECKSVNRNLSSMIKWPTSLVRPKKADVSTTENSVREVAFLCTITRIQAKISKPWYARDADWIGQLPCRTYFASSLLEDLRIEEITNNKKAPARYPVYKNPEENFVLLLDYCARSQKDVSLRTCSSGLKPVYHMIVPIVSVASKSLLSPITSDFANDRSDRDDRGDHMRTRLKSHLNIVIRFDYYHNNFIESYIVFYGWIILLFYLFSANRKL